MNVSAELDLDEKGMVKLCPVTGWTTAPVAEMACLLRMEFVRSDDQLRTGGRETIQFVLTPQQATELSEYLSRMANRIDRTVPTGIHRN